MCSGKYTSPAPKFGLQSKQSLGWSGTSERIERIIAMGACVRWGTMSFWRLAWPFPLLWGHSSKQQFQTTCLEPDSKPVQTHQHKSHTRRIYVPSLLERFGIEHRRAVTRPSARTPPASLQYNIEPTVLPAWRLPSFQPRFCGLFSNMLDKTKRGKGTNLVSRFTFVVFSAEMSAQNVRL